MNNNDPMKRFGYIVFSICLFALSACTPHEQMDQEEGIVKVSMGLTAASFTDDDATTRAEQPMAPDYENLISNLWILQFDREGILTGMQAQYSCFGQDGRDIQQREDPVAECADQRLFVPFGCISVTGRRRGLYGRGCHRCRQSIGDSPPLPLLLYG